MHILPSQRNSSFTLIELLVVIAILAVLAVAVVLILNPVELIKESRDTTRIEDLGTLNKALGYLQTDQPNTSFGSSTTVYVSIPWTTTSTNCSNLGLPALPSGYAYGCAPTSTYQMTDGTGWIPLDFTSLSFGSPFSRLPVDPVNTTSSGYYYTYIPGGSWKLTAFFESADRAPEANKDGGTDAALYEVGTSLTTISPGRGLVGHWRFEEGSGTSATDASGSGNTGTMYSSSTLTSLHTSSGKVGSAAASFDGSDDSVNIADFPIFASDANYTVVVWMYPVSEGLQYPLFNQFGGGWRIERLATTGKANFRLNNGNSAVSTTALDIDNWWFVVGVREGTTMRIYVNGQLEGSGTQALFTYTSSNVYFGWNGGYVGASYFDGKLDDVRIYNRVLSASEIQALYNATR